MTDFADNPSADNDLRYQLPLTAQRTLANDPDTGTLSSPAPMLTRLVTTLTLAATLIHSVLGCCWHHDHGVGESLGGHSVCCGSQLVADPMPGAECFGQEPGGQEDEHPQDPAEPCDHSHGGCTELGCVYVVADDGGVLFNVVEWSVAALPTPVVQVVVVPGEVLDFLRDFSQPRLAAREMRAWLQVWTV